MLRAVVSCETCRAYLAEAKGSTWPELCSAVASALLDAHATKPHLGNHALSFRFSGQADAGAGARRPLSLKCLAECCADKPAFEVSLPIELVAAAAIAFHASHEGHPFAASWDGEKLFESPP